MEEGCFICGMCEAGKDESGVLFCACKGYIRYVVWGVYSPPKKRGPKPKITIHDVLRKIGELPMSARLYDVADGLKAELEAKTGRKQTLDERTVERLIDPYVKMLRRLDPSCVGFEGLKAVIKGKRKTRRLHSSSYKKGLRNS